MNLTELYLHNFHRKHDINEHLPYLAGLALDKTVVELGFRTGRSTSAFLMGGAKWVYVYDTNPCAEARRVFEELAPDRFKFHQKDSRNVIIPECEVLFIDSYHSGEQLYEELIRHAKKVTAFGVVVCHDTETYGHKGQDGFTKGLQWAIRKFTPMRVKIHFPNNNGLTVLEWV